MSALISERCERDMPEVDWERLGENNSKVLDTYTGLRLDETQVKAGRETYVQRMVELNVCEEFSEELAAGKRIWNSSWLDSQKKNMVRTRPVFSHVGRTSKQDDVFAATPPPAALRFIVSSAESRGHGRCLGLCLLHSSAQRLRKKFLFALRRTCRKTRSSGISRMPCTERKLQFRVDRFWCAKH